MNTIKERLYGFRILTMSVLLMLGFSSCMKMGTPTKLAAIAGSGGLLGAAFSQGEVAAMATASAAGSLMAVGPALIIKEVEATSFQKQRANANVNRFFSEIGREKKAALKKSKVRYVAVDTSKVPDTRGARVIMLYDLQEEKLQTKTYEVKVQPQVGQRMKFDAKITQYVGGSGQMDEIRKPDLSRP